GLTTQTTPTPARVELVRRVSARGGCPASPAVPPTGPASAPVPQLARGPSVPCLAQQRAHEQLTRLRAVPVRGELADRVGPAGPPCGGSGPRGPLVRRPLALASPGEASGLRFVNAARPLPAGLG